MNATEAREIVNSAPLNNILAAIKRAASNGRRAVDLYDFDGESFYLEHPYSVEDITKLRELGYKITEAFDQPLIPWKIFRRKKARVEPVKQCISLIISW